MEKSDGISIDLRERVNKAMVAVIGHETIDLISDAIMRLGFQDVAISDDCRNLPECDIVVCTFTEKEEGKAVIDHYRQMGLTVIYAFNFGIGACVSVITPDAVYPHFIEDKYNENVVISMVEYTKGYSAFWNIPSNRWIDDAMKWVRTKEIHASIGEYTMTAMTAHLLIAIVADNKVKTYPKFYLSTIANDVN